MAGVAEEHFILRLPEAYARDVSRKIESDKLNDLRMDLGGADEGKCDVFIGEGANKKKLHGKLVNLPTITETLRTADNKHFFKIADISQMVICTEAPPAKSKLGSEAGGPDRASSAMSMVASSIVGSDDDGETNGSKLQAWPHGLTPPLKNVRRKRFRKTAPKQQEDSPHARALIELQDLLERDRNAKCKEVSWKVIDEQGDVAQMSDFNAFDRQAEEVAAAAASASAAAAGPDASLKAMDASGLLDNLSDDDGNDDDGDDAMSELDDAASTATGGVSIGTSQQSQVDLDTRSNGSSSRMSTVSAGTLSSLAQSQVSSSFTGGGVSSPPQLSSMLPGGALGGSTPASLVSPMPLFSDAMATEVETAMGGAVAPTLVALPQEAGGGAPAAAQSMLLPALDDNPLAGLAAMPAIPAAASAGLPGSAATGSGTVPHGVAGLTPTFDADAMETANPGPSAAEHLSDPGGTLAPTPMVSPQDAAPVAAAEQEQQPAPAAAAAAISEPAGQEVAPELVQPVGPSPEELARLAKIKELETKAEAERGRVAKFTLNPVLRKKFQAKVAELEAEIAVLRAQNTA